jgi:hypothetical protein
MEEYFFENAKQTKNTKFCKALLYFFVGELT